MNIFGFAGQTDSVSAVGHVRQWAWLCATAALFMDPKCEFHVTFMCHELVFFYFFQTFENVNPLLAPGMNRNSRQARFTEPFLA